MTTSYIFDNQIGVIQKPMAPSRFGNWIGWAWLHYYGLSVQCVSKHRFAAGTPVSIEKTLNDDWWWVRVEQTCLINGMDLEEPTPSEFMQGELSL